jgi:hypothetical protein
VEEAAEAVDDAGPSPHVPPSYRRVRGGIGCLAAASSSQTQPLLVSLFLFLPLPPTAVSLALD